jgi:hypothetical protein
MSKLNLTIESLIILYGSLGGRRDLLRGARSSLHEQWYSM